FADTACSIPPTGSRGGVPTLVVTSDGTIFTVGEQSNVLRSRDGGASWQMLDDGISGPPLDFDPFLWVDTTTGRVFNSRMNVVPPLFPNVWLAWTDNQGASWSANPAVGLPMVDHQKLTTGPPPPGVATSGYPNLLYMVYNAARESFALPASATDGVNVAVSNDGGRTFAAHARVSERGCFGGVASPAVVTSGGAAFVASYAASCEALWVARSLDGGATWERVAELAARGAVPWGLDPMMAVDAADNVYAVWIGNDSQLHLSVSQDVGATWTDGARVSAPGITSLVFPDIVAGEAGRVSIAYIGATAPADRWRDEGHPTDDPSFAGNGTIWNLYVAHVPGATAADPLIVTTQVTTDEDPVQRGCIWLHGGSSPCRNLRDFMDMVEHEGNVHVVYADGCPACTDAAGSHVLGETTVVIQQEGPRLRDVLPGRDLPAPGVPEGLREPVAYDFAGRVEVPYYGADPHPAAEGVARDLASDTFDFEVPPGTRFVEGRLEWATAGPTPETSDLDLMLYDAQGDPYDAATLAKPEVFAFELQEGDQGAWRAVVMNFQTPPTDFPLRLVLS
ncbi:MAG: sialidase family protein, partial [Methanobacteriota archaeon]